MTSEALITQLDRRDPDCDFTIEPTRHRLRLNQTLPCAIALHNAFQQPAPNPQSDTNETVAGWTEGPKTLFLEAQRPLWSPVEPWSPLPLLWGPLWTPLTTATCHHISVFTLMSLDHQGQPNIMPRMLKQTTPTLVWLGIRELGETEM